MIRWDTAVVTVKDKTLVHFQKKSFCIKKKLVQRTILIMISRKCHPINKFSFSHLEFCFGLHEIIVY